MQQGATYRVVFQALADDPEKQSATQVRVRFHWRDGEGVETGVDLDALVQVSAWLEDLLGRTLEGQVYRAGPALAAS